MPHRLLTGDETFRYQLSTPPTAKIRDFWSWYCSDLLSNTTRGALAEFIVSMALNINHIYSRDTWAEYDLITPDGIRIEVKCSAYLQSWEQNGKLSKIIFDCSPSYAHVKSYNEFNRNDYARHSDVYVFCVYNCKEPSRSDPLNLDLWEFYVIATKLLNEKLGEQKSIGLSHLQGLTKAIKFHEIGHTVNKSFSGYRNHE